MIKKYILGLDLGQQQDFSVLSVLYTEINEDRIAKYSLQGLKRFNLRTSYPDVVKWVASFLAQPFISDNYVLVVDCTGVGRPVVDMLYGEEIKVIAVNITGGATYTWKHSSEVNVPKKELIVTLLIPLQSGRLKFARGLPLIEEVSKEFLNFKPTFTKDGSTKFGAASGYHDDIVTSIGLATWYGEYLTRKGTPRRLMTLN